MCLWTFTSKVSCFNIFLALSHSPPLLLINIASNNPDNIFPAKNPPIAWTPPINPTTRVAIIAISPAGINSFIAPIVAKFMHFSYSGGTFPSFTPFISLNCLCISVTNFWEFLLTPNINIAENTAGMATPTNAPKIPMDSSNQM